jgi:hypothetical protein
MAFISKIGPLELSFFSFFGALFLYRIQAKPESRIAAGLVFLCCAQFVASFINGFSIAQASKLSFGQLDTVFAYLMLAFVLLEVLLLKSVVKWENTDISILVGLFGLGFLNLWWRLISGYGLSANDFVYSAVILLFLLLRPTRADLRFLPYFGAVIVLLVFICALAKYQNPLFPYTQLDYGLGGPYQNRVWDVFGWEERFRGPYYHPNQLGIQITFLSFLVLLGNTKLYVAVLPISFTLLFLSSSRTSILALCAGFLLKLYFDRTKHEGVDSSYNKYNMAKGHPRRPLKLKKVFIGFFVASVIFLVARQIIGNNRTGSGRLENYGTTFSLIRDNFLFGRGPSLFSITSTENTVLTLISYYGLMGLVILVTVVFALITKFKKMARNERDLFHIALTMFLVASSGEAVLTGSTGDTGLYYLLIFLSLTRSEYSRKELLQP